MVEDLKAGTDGATLGVVTPVHHAKNPGLNDCAGTHGAGFNGDIQRGSEDAVISYRVGRRAQRQDFRVRRGIAGRNRAIARAGQDGFSESNDRTHRHLALFGRGTRFSQRQTHVVGVGRHFIRIEQWDARDTQRW